MRREAFVVSSANHRALRPLNYTPAVEALKAARGSHGSIQLGKAVSEFGPGYATVFARIDAAPEHGVELLSQTDMFAAEPIGRWIRRDSMAHPERHEVKRWQILIAGAGTLGENELYGRPVLANGDLVGKYVGQHTFSLAFDPPGSDLNLYTYAFLTSRTGLEAVRATSYGTKVLGFRKDLLAEVPIPRANATTMSRVAALVRKAVAERDAYAANIRAARQLIEELPAMRDAHRMCAARHARCVDWRGDLPTLCAWTFASTGGAFELLSRRWRLRLSDVVPVGGIFRGNRSSRIPCASPHGTLLLSQRDVFLVRPFPQRVLLSAQALAGLTVPVGSLLVGGQGTLGEGEIFGRVALVTPDFAGSAITEHLLRIQPTPRYEGLVYAYFSTLVGLRLLRSAAVGTKLLSLRPDLVLRLPIPELSTEDAGLVSDRVGAAMAARAGASEAERSAIRIIEEEVLPQWLA